MVSPATSNLVFVEAKAEDGTFRFGTGYLVTENRVLTAGHVLGAPGDPPTVAVRVRQESTKEWFAAVPEPVWRTDGIDATVLELSPKAAPDVETVEYGTTVDIDEKTDWETTAYPGVMAQAVKPGGAKHYSTSGLDGTWYPQGGQGQLADSNARFLDLGVEYPPKDWHGISGAPILAGGKLIGIIDSAQPDWDNKRLTGVPIEHIANSPGFIATTEPSPYDVPADSLWFLVVLASNTSPKTKGLIESALKAFEGQRQGLSPKDFGDVDVAQIVVNIDDELATPGRWLGFTELLTSAPIAVADVTKFEPAMMLALGVRAVARRGITVTVTRDDLTEANLAALPFNIKEARLISLHPSRPDARDVLVRTISRGLEEQNAGTDYLDLPAYESVRTRKPPATTESHAEFLVLCPFDHRYEPHWQVVREAITRTHAGHKGVRMLDIVSPRLSGQALYEQIRWNPYCLVDWTEWRANVFFELGVRLTCSEYDPIMIIHDTGWYDSVNGHDTPPEQHDLLRNLFRPVRYTTTATDEDSDIENPGVDEAFSRHRALLRSQEVSTPPGVVPPGATREIVATAYYWKQERLLERPDTALQRRIEDRVGADSERDVGENDVLFSSNRDFSRALKVSMQEDWLAAWFYARGRAGPDPSVADQTVLLVLGNKVLRALAGSASPVHTYLRIAIGDELEKWEDDGDL